MPSIDGTRAWLETATTLKVPEFKLASDSNSASSYIAARPGEAFCLRYDHVPVEGFDLAWKLSIVCDDQSKPVEQWGGPPLEMRKSRGTVKVRAMRMSEDGTQFRAFAWTDDTLNEAALSGTITLSLHLCHFAEATADIPSATRSTVEVADKPHALLAPAVTKPTASKLWTWYWRDEQPQLTFKFTYGPKEKLQAQGIIPISTVDKIVQTPASQNLALSKTVANHAKVVFGHKPRISSGALMGVPPRELIKHQQKIRMSDMWRKRGLSTSSTESDVSSDAEQQGVSYLHD